MTPAAAALSIRAGDGDDATAIHGLLRELAQTTGLQHKFHSTAAALRRHGSGDAPFFETLVAETTDGIVGVALYFYTFSSWRGEPGVYLQDIAVTRDARGGRIGERLMQALARVARTRGATHLRLAVDRDNAAAQRFYERLGLRAADDDRIFEIDGDAFTVLGASG